MEIFTGNSKLKTITKLEVDSGGRETAACRWDRYKDTAHRTAVYHASAPNITPEDSLIIIELERLYIETYSEWEASTINDVQYKILQDYLPPEYFLYVLAVYLCIRYYDLPETIEELKNKTFHITEEDRHYFINYLRLIYLPAIIEFIDKCKEIRPRYVIYKEVAGIFEETSGQGENIELDPDKSLKLSNLLLEFNKGMSIFLTCLNVDAGREISLSDVFGDLTEKIISGHGFTKEKEIEIAPIPIEKAQVVYPNNLLMNSTKVAQNLGDIVELGEYYGYNVAPKKKKTSKKEDFLVTVIFEHSNEKLVELSRPITQTDKNIMDAIETLAQTNSFITASEVYRMLNGGEHVKVTPEIIAEYESRIDYMIDIKATVNYSRHMNLNGKEGEFNLKGPLLNLYKATRKLNGKTVTGYIYIAPSPVFMYAKEVNQIVSVPAALLNTKSVQNGGERSNNIKFYLLFRLHTIEGQGKIISLDKILSVIGVPSPTAQQLRAIRKTIENFLDLWSYGKLKASKAAPDKDILEKSPIKGYSVNTVGKKITGYTLIPKNIVVK